MDEVQRLTAEREAVLKIIKQQQGKILVELTELEKNIKKDAEEPWYSQLDITRMVMQYIEKQKALLILYNEQYKTLDEYLIKIMSKVGVEMATTYEDEEVPVTQVMPRSPSLTKKEMEEFEERILMRIEEWMVMRKRDPNKAKVRYMTIFKEIKDPNKEEKKKIIARLLGQAKKQIEAEKDEGDSEEGEIEIQGEEEVENGEEN